MSAQRFNVRDKRTQRRYFIDNALLRGGWGKEIGPYGIAVYNAIALHADIEDQSGWPSQQTIADLTGMSRPTVNKTIAKLASLRLIAIKPREGTSHTYYLLDSDEWIPVKQVNTPCKAGLHPPVNEVYTNNPHLNKPKEQETPTADAGAPTPISPPADPVKEEYKTPVNLDGWLDELRGTNNRVAVLRRMLVTLFPGEEPAYSYVGKIAKQVGGAGRCATLLWQAAGQRITGDPLRYISVMKRNGGTNGRTQPVEQVELATGLGPPLTEEYAASIGLLDD